LYPRFGSEKGGTPIEIIMTDVPSQQIIQSPLTCRFSFDFEHSGTSPVFETSAEVVNFGANDLDAE